MIKVDGVHDGTCRHQDSERGVQGPRGVYTRHEVEPDKACSITPHHRMTKSEEQGVGVDPRGLNAKSIIISLA